MLTQKDCYDIFANIVGAMSSNNLTEPYAIQDNDFTVPLIVLIKEGYLNISLRIGYMSNDYTNYWSEVDNGKKLNKAALFLKEYKDKIFWLDTQYPHLTEVKLIQNHKIKIPLANQFTNEFTEEVTSTKEFYKTLYIYDEDKDLSIIGYLFIDGSIELID